MTVKKIINMAHYRADILQMHVILAYVRNGCLHIHTRTRALSILKNLSL